jgi:hypothetical protein
VWIGHSTEGITDKYALEGIKRDTLFRTMMAQKAGLGFTVSDLRSSAPKVSEANSLNRWSGRGGFEPPTPWSRSRSFGLEVIGLAALINRSSSPVAPIPPWPRSLSFSCRASCGWLRESCGRNDKTRSRVRYHSDLATPHSIRGHTPWMKSLSDSHRETRKTGAHPSYLPLDISE